MLISKAKFESEVRVIFTIFKLYRPILPFWNSQSLIYNILLLEKYAMNGKIEIEEFGSKLLLNQCLVCSAKI